MSIAPAIHPSQPLRIVTSSHVTAESGTGLVHCAPAHGAEDYNAFRALGLITSSSTILCHVGREGTFTDEVAQVVGETVGRSLAGQAVLKEGSMAVIQLLEEIGVLVKLEKIKHRYPYDWKTNEPIIVTCVVFPILAFHDMHCRTLISKFQRDVSMVCKFRQH